MGILKRFCIVLGTILSFFACCAIGIYIMRIISPNDSIFQESVFTIYTAGLFTFIVFLGMLFVFYKIIEFIYNVVKYILTGEFYEE